MFYISERKHSYCCSPNMDYLKQPNHFEDTPSFLLVCHTVLIEQPAKHWHLAGQSWQRQYQNLCILGLVYCKGKKMKNADKIEITVWCWNVFDKPICVNLLLLFITSYQVKVLATAPLRYVRWIKIICFTKSLIPDWFFIVLIVNAAHMCIVWGGERVPFTTILYWSI